MTQQEIDVRINELFTEIINAKNYLASTDYKVIKVAEGIEEEDAEIKQLRIDARKAVNDAQDEIERLKALTPDEPVVDENLSD